MSFHLHMTETNLFSHCSIKGCDVHRNKALLLSSRFSSPACLCPLITKSPCRQTRLLPTPPLLVRFAPALLLRPLSFMQPDATLIVRTPNDCGCLPISAIMYALPNKNKKPVRHPCRRRLQQARFHTRVPRTHPAHSQCRSRASTRSQPDGNLPSHPTRTRIT